MAALWTVEYVGGAIRVRRHRSQADAEAYRDAVLRADGRFLSFHLSAPPFAPMYRLRPFSRCRSS